MAREELACQARGAITAAARPFRGCSAGTAPARSPAPSLRRALTGSTWSPCQPGSSGAPQRAQRPLRRQEQRNPSLGPEATHAHEAESDRSRHCRVSRIRGAEGRRGPVAARRRVSSRSGPRDRTPAAARRRARPRCERFVGWVRVDAGDPLHQVKVAKARLQPEVRSPPEILDVRGIERGSSGRRSPWPTWRASSSASNAASLWRFAGSGRPARRRDGRARAARSPRAADSVLNAGAFAKEAHEAAGRCTQLEEAVEEVVGGRFGFG